MDKKAEINDLPVDLNGNKIVFDGTQIWGEVLKDLKKWEKEKGLGKAFEDEPAHVPVHPAPGFMARYVAGYSRHKERSIVDHYKKDEESWTNMMARPIPLFWR